MLWLNTSGRASNSNCSDAVSPLASDTNVSMVVPGLWWRIWLMHSATWPKPPSGRSSRATMVSTACCRRICATAEATRSGSSTSGRSGLRVSTKQNPQARVQRSPNTMNVAVPSRQHSDKFGQPASSQTVTRCASRRIFLVANTSAPCDTCGRSHSGLRS